MIAHSFDEAFSQVQVLVNDFRQNEPHFLSPQYSEPRVREDFINKFWMALGWDVTHSEQKNPYEQEVTVEKNVNVEGRGKRADYAFTVAPSFRDVRFFVEAKKPSRNIDNADDYFQTVRYGWNARTQVAVLTDFEQFRVLDCRYEPDIDSVLSYGALEKFHYSDYADPEKFRRIYHLFSRADVAGGSLERYAEGLPKPGARGQRALIVTGRFKSVDESFLQKLDEYRERLAQTFKRNNPQLESPELTEVTQRTLDRLVFMRFLEDKLIETSELVQKIVDSARPWREFVATSRKLNATYNGIIFKEHSLLDGADFEVDERAFVDICASLSYARSPYNFNYIPIHILGSIYERFLGKTIVVEGAEASVEDKPEVRKAGGVYYTPEYIVRYIVENTVGELIKGKTTEEISKMHFADISCGSGSFLIGVYDLLLRYHRTYYNANKKRKAEGKRAGGVELPDGTLQLSLKQKRAILTNNIYGVDIDAQAVEVAQLSLYLKLLEDETTASARHYQIELGDKVLPSLSKNIISGNSLIDWDILSGKLFDKHEERKLNPMNFKEEFPQIMKDGGFDAIVGNPPYVDIKGLPLTNVEYIFSNYKSANNRINLFGAFIEKSLALVKSTRFRLSMIVPTALLTQDSYKALRRMIIGSYRVSDLVRLPNESFGGAAGDVKVDTVIFVIKEQGDIGEPTHIIGYAGYDRISEINSSTAHVNGFVQQEVWAESADCVWAINITGGDESILLKCESGSIPLEECADISLGLTPYDKYRGHTFDQITNRVFHADYQKDETFKKLLAGNDVMRYVIQWGGKEWISYGQWLGAPREQRFFKDKRILVKQIIDWTTKRIWACISEEELYNTQNAFNILPKSGWSAEYLLGIINSRLMTFYHRKKFLDEFKMRFQKILIKDCRRFPIRPIDFSNPTDKARHDMMVQLVEQMLEAKKQLVEAVTDRDRNLYERKCANLDRQIDELVYELYGLTKEEIELVEAS